MITSYQTWPKRCQPSCVSASRLSSEGLAQGAAISGERRICHSADSVAAAANHVGIIAIGEEARVVVQDSADEILRCTFADGLRIA